MNTFKEVFKFFFSVSLSECRHKLHVALLLVKLFSWSTIKYFKLKISFALSSLRSKKNRTVRYLPHSWADHSITWMLLVHAVSDSSMTASRSQAFSIVGTSFTWVAVCQQRSRIEWLLSSYSNRWVCCFLKATVAVN